MLMLAALALPALLAPQVRTGQQLHYRTTWTRQISGPQLAGVRPNVSGVAYTVTVSDASPAHVSWSRQYTGGSNSALKFASDLSGQVIDRGSGKAAGLPVFIYNAALLGQPPAVLHPGVTWTNSIHHPGGDELWTSTVEEAIASTGAVRLRLSFQGHASAGFNGDKYVRDQREYGAAIFVHGVMTELSLQGRETTTYPESRITNAVAIETRLEDPGSP